MRRINLRDVPDEVYDDLSAAAEGHRQSLNAYVVGRLAEIARAARVADHVAAYGAPRTTGVSTDDAVEAVRRVREAS